MPEIKLASRAERIARVKAALADAGIDPDIRQFEQSAATARLAAEALECGVGQIVKSLIFRSGDSPLLALVGGDARADPKKLSLAMGAEIHKADAEFVRICTGFEIGGVAPLGHLSPKKITAIMDSRLFSFEIIWASAGSTRSVFAISPKELARVSSAKIADIAAEN